MRKLGSANWKDRAAALDAVATAVRGAGGRIAPTLGDLMGALKVTRRQSRPPPPFRRPNCSRCLMLRWATAAAGESRRAHVALQKCRAHYHWEGVVMAGAVLQGRLADANKNLTQRTLQLMGELGAAMGPPIERAARVCFLPALHCLADKKKPVRMKALPPRCSAVQ